MSCSLLSDSVFWMGISTMVVGIIMVAFKIKCKECNICYGLIKCIRQPDDISDDIPAMTPPIFTRQLPQPPQQPPSEKNSHV